MKDLKKMHVRFIKDPNKRIIEDYLRILRFYRFTAEYGDPNLGIYAEGLSACAGNIDVIVGIIISGNVAFKNPADA